MRARTATALTILFLSVLPAAEAATTEGAGVSGVVVAAGQAHPARPMLPGVAAKRPELLRGEDLERPVWTGEEPLSLVAAVDLSASVSGARLRAVGSGLRSLFSSLGEEDRCALLGFSRSVTLHAGWEAGCVAAASAANELSSGGPAALNNALTLAFGLLAEVPGRPVLVLFTDGVDGASWARDSWPLFAAGAVPPTVLAVTAPPSLTSGGRVGGLYGSISSDDLANQIVFEGRNLQDSGRDLRGLRSVDPFWVLTQLAEMSLGQVVRTGGSPEEIEAALTGLLAALQPE